MMHDNRLYSVAPVATAEALVERLTEASWCLCTGFQLGDLLWLNDSFSEDSAQEYAVLRTGRPIVHQIESITASWCAPAELLAHIRALQAGDGVDMGIVTPRIDRSIRHRCPLCA